MATKSLELLFIGLTLVFHIASVAGIDYCYKGWTLYDEKCIQVFGGARPRTVCSGLQDDPTNGLHAYPVFLKSKEKNDFVKSLMSDASVDRAYMGLEFKEGEISTCDRDDLECVRTKHWYWRGKFSMGNFHDWYDSTSQNEPAYDDKCAMLSRASPQEAYAWHGTTCNDRIGVVCESRPKDCDIGDEVTENSCKGRCTRPDEDWLELNNKLYCIGGTKDDPTSLQNYAADKCRLHGANLASVNDIDENDFMADIMIGKEIHRAWIGLKTTDPSKLAKLAQEDGKRPKNEGSDAEGTEEERRRDWAWADGSDYSPEDGWTNWLTNDTPKSKDTCVMLARLADENKQYQYGWLGTYCARKLPYLCVKVKPGTENVEGEKGKQASGASRNYVGMLGVLLLCLPAVLHDLH